MKRLSFITLFLLASVCAKAQVISCYGETYEKETGKFRGKVWMSAERFRMETPDNNGKTGVIIYRADSAKVYRLDMEKKTWMSFTLSQITGGTLSGVAAFEVESRSVTREFRGEELIEGTMCRHYRVKGTSALKGGSTDHNDYDEWICESDKIWRQRSDEIRAGRYLVQRNIRTGAHPDNLFEIPRDFKGMSLPAGGMLEMFTGKTQQQNQQVMDGKNQKANDFSNKMNDIKNDPNKTDEQKIQDALKLLEEMNKKK